ncbi:ATP-dependent helicase [Candidatus Liberibacter brunswickensis]|uniref:ATP-dependent helicase n=1 Tax=Candidatus Liberibacter brunswickensis TaxID=1968796 RepID=UPI002FE0403B
MHQDNKKGFLENYFVDHQRVSNYLARLNPQQLHAATITNENPIFVLAGAGTGKTTVLIARILHLIFKKKIMPSKIIAITFTNQAIKEIKNRVYSLLEEIPQIKTFHSFCAGVLRKHGELVGLPDNFAIIDSNDNRTIIKQILKESSENEYCDINLAIEKIKYWQDNGWNPMEIPESSLTENEIIPRKIYTRYIDYLDKEKSCDFGGLIIKAIEILNKHPHILKSYHENLSYIMVDEYQDINNAQYLLLRLLYQKQGNHIYCVGDEDQCIYEWRGAHFSHITNFEKEFKKATIIKLEQNYRSTSYILNTANRLISHNKKRYNKRLFTTRDYNDDVKLKIHVSQNDSSELSTIITEIINVQNQGLSLNNIAILVRTSWQTRKFEEAFLEKKIPYKVIGAISFYDRQEIRDSLAYFRLVCHQGNNKLNFERIINYPKRGIGKESIKKIKTHATQRQISLLEASEELIENNEFRPKARQSLKNFIDNIRRWSNLSKQSDPGSIAHKILEESDYISSLKDNESEKSQERLDNIKELISIIAQYETLESYIINFNLQENTSINFTSSIIDSNFIKIMTMHAAKGLEFDTVFISGWEQGLIPHKLSIKEGDLEGERRLAYMGITRAKNNCNLFYTINRRTHDFTNKERYQQSQPSQFLVELYDPSDVQEIIHDGIYGSFSDLEN